MTLTRKENLLKVLRCENPEWVPFSPNFNQWFQHHKKFNQLPPELVGKDYTGAMKFLGCDIFSRNIDGGFRSAYPIDKFKRTVEEKEIGPLGTEEYETPYGTLRMRSQYQSRLTTGHVIEYPVKNWEKEGDAAKYYVENRERSWDEKAFEKTQSLVADDGLVIVAVGCTPLKMLHELLGLQEACFLIMDNETAAKEICDLYWSKHFPVFKKAVDQEGTHCLILQDNVDTPFYPPYIAEKYWTPYVKEAMDYAREKGKFLLVHACGRLAGLKEEYAKSKITGLEGVSHAPLGDWSPEEALETHDKFIFNGGFSAQEQEMKTDGEVRDFYEDYFSRVPADKNRFIFGSSCQTSIGTTWERIKLVRDICRDWGGNLIKN